MNTFIFVKQSNKRYSARNLQKKTSLDVVFGKILIIAIYCQVNNKKVRL